MLTQKIVTLISAMVFGVAVEQSGQIHDAVKNGDIDQVKALLTQDPNLVSACDDSGWNSLHLAVAEGHIEIVRLLLTKGAELNEATKDYKLTALHLASGKNRKDIVELLLAKGAQIDARDTDGQTPLHRAGKRGATAVAELLIERGSNVNGKDDRGETPLHKASNEGHRALAELLIANQAMIDASDKQGETPLHKAAYDAPLSAYGSEGSPVQVLLLLLQKGANVNAQNDQGNTALHIAAQGDKAEIVKLLLDNGADHGVHNKWRRTPLHFAIAGQLYLFAGRKAGFKAVGALIEAGANINVTDHEGRMPIHDAAIALNKNAIEMLIAKGANVHAEDKKGNTPFDLAVSNGEFQKRAPVAELIIKKMYTDKTISERGPVRLSVDVEGLVKLTATNLLDPFTWRLRTLREGNDVKHASEFLRVLLMEWFMRNGYDVTDQKNSPQVRVIYSEKITQRFNGGHIVVDNLPGRGFSSTFVDISMTIILCDASGNRLSRSAITGYARIPPNLRVGSLPLQEREISITVVHAIEEVFDKVSPQHLVTK